MGLISLTLPNDGETIDAADVNSPLNTIATAINGNLDNANIKTAAAIDGSKIASASLTSTQMADSVSPVKRWDEGLFDFVASGCVWTGDAYGSTRAASMTAGVVYINGKRVSISAVTARSFTASKDTYIDVDDSGTISYSEVTNNAASPSLAANSIRIGIIITGASNIANVGSINQGQQDKVLPIASSVPYSVTDSLGNLICNRNPNPSLIGYRQITGNITTTSVTAAQATGLSCPVIVPTGRRVRVSFYAPNLGNNTANTNDFMTIWDGTVGSGTQLVSALWTQVAGITNYNMANTASAVVTPASASKTYNAGIHVTGGTMTVIASATSPSYIIVELV